jgi:hypothetical protein
MRRLLLGTHKGRLTLNRITYLSNWARLNVIGLLLTAGGMLLQVASGSHLYPSLTGPIVLVVAAVFVAVGPRGWTPYVGILVPLVLGIGAIVAAAMTGEFAQQLTDLGNAGVFLGSVMHVLGLVAAVAGGVGMLVDQRSRVSVAR